MANPIGDRIRAEREAQDLLQKELATRARVPRTWLNNVEKGVSESPRPERLYRVAKALGTTTDYLISGDRPSGDTEPVSPEERDLLQVVRRMVTVPTRAVTRTISRLYHSDDEMFYDLSGAKDEDRGHTTDR